MPSAGGKGVTLETVGVRSQVHGLGGIHHGDYGCEIPGIGSGRWGYQADYLQVFLVTGSG